MIISLTLAEIGIANLIPLCYCHSSDLYFSLSIHKLSELLNKEFSITGVRVIDLFARPTLQDQAALIDTACSGRSRSTSLAPLSIDVVLPALTNLEASSRKEDIISGITEIWVNILGTRPNVQTNFFDAGGHRYVFIRAQIFRCSSKASAWQSPKYIKPFALNGPLRISKLSTCFITPRLRIKPL